MKPGMNAKDLSEVMMNEVNKNDIGKSLKDIIK